MSGNSNNKSDLGFIIFLVLAIIILIPLAIGFDSFESLFRTMKIVLGIIFSLLIIIIGIGGYYFYQRKVKNRNLYKKKITNENSKKVNTETEVKEIAEEKTDVIIQEIGKEDIIEHEIQLTDKKTTELKDINKKFDL